VERALLAIILVAWLVGMWTMLRMILAGWNAGQRWFGIISPSVPVASYNGKNLRMFASCIGVAVAAAIVYNALLLTGYINF
jgi:hypothetical protein